MNTTTEQVPDFTEVRIVELQNNWVQFHQAISPNSQYNDATKAAFQVCIPGIRKELKDLEVSLPAICDLCFLQPEQCNCIPTLSKEELAKMQKNDNQTSLATQALLDAFTDSLKSVDISKIKPGTEWQYCPDCHVRIYTNARGFSKFCKCELNTDTSKHRRKRRSAALDRIRKMQNKLELFDIGLPDERLQGRVNATEAGKREHQISLALANAIPVFCEVTGKQIGQINSDIVADMITLGQEFHSSISDRHPMLQSSLVSVPEYLKELQLNFPCEYSCYTIFRLSSTFKNSPQSYKFAVYQQFNSFQLTDIHKLAELLRHIGGLFGRAMMRGDWQSSILGGVNWLESADAIILDLKSRFLASIEEMQLKAHSKDTSRTHRISLADVSRLKLDAGSLLFRDAKLGQSDDDEDLQAIAALFGSAITTKRVISVGFEHNVKGKLVKSDNEKPATPIFQPTLGTAINIKLPSASIPTTAPVANTAPATQQSFKLNLGLNLGGFGKKLISE